MIPIHRISDEHFTALASGHGGTSAIAELWRAQRSRRLLLLRYIVGNWPKSFRERDAAVVALGEAERSSAAAVRDIVADPLVGAWAASTVRQLEGADTGGIPIEVRLGRLGAVAAVAALRAGVDADLESHVWGGALSLPTLGTARLAYPDGTRVRLVVRSGHLHIDGSRIGDPDNRWEPVRRLTASAPPPIDVAFDDVDPYRDEYHVPAADRIPDEQAAEWQHRFASAWRVVSEFAPSRAAEMVTGLQALVPLRLERHSARSATTAGAVGVVGLDLPPSDAEFAVTLIHEFQHSKLAALTDMVPLFNVSSEETFFAPWRRDPRPVGGLFQGVYAFFGVAEMWRALSAEPDRFPQAPLEFADTRAQVTDAVETLASSGLLTPAGRRFVRRLRSAVRELHGTKLPPATVATADNLLVERRIRWSAEPDRTP